MIRRKKKPAPPEPRNERREIEFRGKSEAGKWAYGYLYITHTHEHQISSYNKALRIERSIQIVRPETVGQYTGFKGIKRRKVYEGDILKVTPSINPYVGAFEPDWNEAKTVIVFWDLINYGWKVIGAGAGEPCYMHGVEAWVEHSFEVIGNIFDNPELLDRKENENGNE